MDEEFEDGEPVELVICCVDCRNPLPSGYGVNLHIRKNEEWGYRTGWVHRECSAPPGWTAE